VGINLEARTKVNVIKGIADHWPATDCPSVYNDVTKSGDHDLVFRAFAVVRRA
jgi:hypothetical protein